MADRAITHIILTEQDGTATSFPVRGPINRGPENGQQQVTTVGEADRRGDSRTPEVIFTDQAGGMGEFAYQEINGVLSFTDSDCDTRYPGMVVLPPARALLGTMSYSPHAPLHVEYLGQAHAKIATWEWDNSSSSRFANRYDPSPAGFNSLLFQNTTGFARYFSYFVFVLSTASGVKYSTDGVTWNTTAYAHGLYGCCTHDGKFYAWDATLSALVWTTDITSAAGWGQSATFPSGETVIQLLEWRVGNATAVFVVTAGRIFWYDEDGDTFHVLDDFRELVGPTVRPWAHSWRRDGNLYLTLYDVNATIGTDSVIWYAGTINLAGPNLRGGMLTASQVSLTHAVGNRRWLFFGGAAPPGTANAGRTLLMTDQTQFHTISPAPAASSVVGIGYGYDTLWTALADGKVYEQAVPDSGALPLYASGRTYQTGTTYYHEYAFTDLGTENMVKTALWVMVSARDPTSTYKTQGLATNCSLVVQWLRDTDSAWQTLATLTSATAFPASLPFNIVGSATFGVAFYQMKLRVGFLSSTAANTPVLTSVALACLREEWVRDRYSCAIDLGSKPQTAYPGGKTRTQLLTVLERLRQPGHLVTLQFAGGELASPAAIGRTIASCKLEFSGTEDAALGPGVYSVAFTDYSPPNPQTPVALPHS